MRNVLLVDFGSTYTKVTLADLEKEEIIGTAQSFTTIETDITEGLSNAIKNLSKNIGKEVEYKKCYACSSAAGGLKMVVSGLVPSLTAEAAKRASLGAGAKILKTYSYGLTKEDVEEIISLKPDIFLLAGGTDGGNTECALTSAKTLSEVIKEKVNFPFIIACNRRCQAEVEELLKGQETFRCKNVMPTLGKLEVDEVQKCIREVFLRNIIKAKGLDKAEGMINGITMPTPSAVMEAIKLLGNGTKNEKGIGELVAFDVGGATTDIYSVAKGDPTRTGTVLKGLEEPYVKRTVEGDIGMRYSIHGIKDAASEGELAKISGLSEEYINERIEYLSKHTDQVPQNADEAKLDQALASVAVKTALRRHAGMLEETYTGIGLTYIQIGKDLTEVQKAIVTGGSLIHTQNTLDISSYAMYKVEDGLSLRPKKVEVLLDQKYILASMGILSAHEPDIALRILKKELKSYGVTN